MAKKKKMAALGDALKTAVLESGMTPYAVAQGSGLPNPTLTRFLRGERSLTLASAERLAAFFQMTLTEPQTPKQGR